MKKISIKNVKYLIIAIICITAVVAGYWKISSMYTSQIDEVINKAFLEPEAENTFEIISDDVYAEINTGNVPEEYYDEVKVNINRDIFKWYKKESEYGVDIKVLYFPSEAGLENDFVPYQDEKSVIYHYRLLMKVEVSGKKVKINGIERVYTQDDY